jgi:hypothetical protein
MPEAFPSLDIRANTHKFFVLPFADIPSMDVQDGTASGSIAFSPNMSLVIAGTESGSRDIMLSAPMMSNIVVSSGIISAIDA